MTFVEFYYCRSSILPITSLLKTTINLKVRLLIDSDSDDLTGEIGLYIQFEDHAVREKVFTEDGFRQFSLNLRLYWTCDEAKKREGGNGRGGGS